MLPVTTCDKDDRAACFWLASRSFIYRMRNQILPAFTFRCFEGQLPAKICFSQAKEIQHGDNIHPWLHWDTVLASTALLFKLVPPVHTCGSLAPRLLGTVCNQSRVAKLQAGFLRDLSKLLFEFSSYRPFLCVDSLYKPIYVHPTPSQKPLSKTRLERTEGLWQDKWKLCQVNGRSCTPQVYRGTKHILWVKCPWLSASI